MFFFELCMTCDHAVDATNTWRTTLSQQLDDLAPEAELNPPLVPLTNASEWRAAQLYGAPNPTKKLFGVCRAELIGDSTYFKKDCKSNYNLCTAKLAQVLRLIDEFYRRQSFGSTTHRGLGFSPLAITLFRTAKEDPLDGAAPNQVYRNTGKYRGKYKGTCLKIWQTNRDMGGLGIAAIGESCRHYRYREANKCALCRRHLAKGQSNAIIGLCGSRVNDNDAIVTTRYGKLKGLPCST